VLSLEVGQPLVLLQQNRERKRRKHVARKFCILGLCLNPLQTEGVQLQETLAFVLLNVVHAELTMAEQPSIAMRIQQVRKNHSQNMQTIMITPMGPVLVSACPRVMFQRTTLSC
jgi:hypothetical protein